MRFLLGLCCGALLLSMLARDPTALRDAWALLVEGDGPSPAVSDTGSGPSSGSGSNSGSGSKIGPSRDGSGPGAAHVGEPSSAPDAPVTGDVEHAWPAAGPLPEAFGDEFAWWRRLEDAARDVAASADASSASMEASATETAPDAVPDAVPNAVDTSMETANAPSAATIEDVDREAVDSPAVAGAGPETDALAEVGTGSAPAQGGDAAGSLDATADVASVWIPFHSERSARGFAQRLSRALEQSFAVRREGPGRYQVVFPYADAGERDEVLARVAMLTGTRP